MATSRVLDKIITIARTPSRRSGPNRLASLILAYETGDVVDRYLARVDDVAENLDVK